MPATGSMYGHIGHPQNTQALMDTITKLKHDLQKSQTDKKNMVEQMNVLITLIKRAWGGDYNATLHLANIVGVPPPSADSMYNSSNNSHPPNTPAVPEYRDHVVRAWERMSVRLLEREYYKIQEEIQERQQLHIMNRNLYMEEILHSHAKDMEKVPTLHTKGKPGRTLEDVDNKFIKTFQHHTQTPGKPRPASGKNRSLYRVKSAPAQRRKSQEVQNMTLNDLMVEPVQGHSMKTDSTNQVFSGLYHMDNGSKSNQRATRLTYDDPHRYQQTNLFDLDSVFGPNEQRKVNRPMSAFTPSRAGGSKNGQTTPVGTMGGTKKSPASRPTSAVFVTQKGERPLKYETTRPVSGRPSKQKVKSSLRSASQPSISVQPNYADIHTKLQSNPELEEYDDDEDDLHMEAINRLQDRYDEERTIDHVQHAQFSSDSEEEVREDLIGNNLRFRVDVATNQPKSVGKFEEEMKTMQAMEKDFNKTAEQLQKKLGISSQGMI